MVGVLCNRVIGSVLSLDHYVKFFYNQLIDLLEDIPLTLIRLMQIKQDGVAPQNVAGAHNFLNENFPDRLNEVTRSPDPN